MEKQEDQHEGGRTELLKTIRSLPSQVFRYRRDGENNHAITFSEGGVAQEFGMSTAEVKGRTLEEVLGEEAKAEYGEYYERAFAGETVNFEAKQAGRWFFSLVTPFITGDDGEVSEIIGYSVDISERKETENRLSLAQRFADVGIWEYGFEGDSLYWNPECERLFGLDEGEFEGTFEAFLSYVHPEDRDLVRSENEAIFQKENPENLEFEHRITRKDGETRWVRELARPVTDENGDLDRVVGMVMDITERKKTQEKLRENEEKYRAIVEESHDGIYIQRGDRFLFVNDEVSRIMGYSKEEIYEKSIWDMLHPEDREYVKEIGERIVSQVDRLEKAAKIIGQHQERYDGTGYPNGLREEEISLEARIIAVVDAWDTMRTDRPYRDALTREEARQELRENAGKQFDPEIVELFLEIIEKERVEVQGV